MTIEVGQLVVDKNDPRMQVGEIELIDPHQGALVRWHISYASFLPVAQCKTDLPPGTLRGDVLHAK